MPISAVTMPGGSGSATFESARRRWTWISALRVVGQLEREGVGARLDLARELVAGDPEDERRRRASPARRREAPPGRAGRPRIAGRAPPPSSRVNSSPSGVDDDQEGEAARHVVVLHVAELVGDDASQLRAVGPAEQVVVEDDPLGRSDPVDIGVQRAHPAARVDAVHLPDVDPGPPRQLEHLGAGRAVRRERRRTG